MRSRSMLRVVVVAFVAVVLLSAARSATRQNAEFVAIVKALLAPDLNTDWEGLDGVPGVRWAAVRSLDNCLPDGGCYTRQGAAVLAGRNLTIFASGARTIFSYVYIRNGSAPFGEAAILAALQEAGYTTELARCPVRGGRGSTNWYRLTSESTGPGVLSIQTSCNGRPCEGFVISRGEDLQPLQANQVSLYSTQCDAGAVQTPVASGRPHEMLADAIVALLPPASGTAGYAWAALRDLKTGVTWKAGDPTRMDMSVFGDTNPLSLTGEATYADRRFNVRASGTDAVAKAVFFEEGGMHPRGEHLLGVVYERGHTVALVRCGPIYTESTNNWYRVTSQRTRPVMVRQSIRYDGNQVQDVYEVRLDGTLPPRDPRDRDPGVNGCA